MTKVRPVGIWCGAFAGADRGEKAALLAWEGGAGGI